MGGVLAAGCGSPAAGSRRTTRAACSTSSRTASATSARTPASCTTWRSRRPRSARSPRVSASTGWPPAPGWSTRSRSAPRRRASGSWTGSCTRCSQEEQVFRIDHFLGKEGTQDLHALRFGNSVFDQLWSAEHVRAVQIDVPETLDIADRAEFYDATGALLDMIVTHLFQLAAEVAMETPALAVRGRPAGRPGGRHRRVPAAGPGRGGARAVRRLPGHRGRGAGLADRHVRRRPAVDRHAALARRAVPAPYGQAAQGERAADQPDLPGAERAAGRPAAGRTAPC